MYKFFIFSMIVVLLLVPSVLGIDIAYVVKDVNNPESRIINSIEDSGYSYELIDDSDVSDTDFNDYDMILLGDENINNVPVNDYSSLFMDTDYHDDWSSSTGSSYSSNIPTAFNLQNTITNGMTGEFPVYTNKNVPIYYLSRKESDVSAVTLLSGSTTTKKYVIATKQEPRRVFFGITKTDYWSSDSERLFENSLEWILGNRLPVCSEIPDLEWNEDEEISFDLNDYCYDPEDSDLEFEIEDTSPDRNITLVDLGDGIINFVVEENWNGEDWVVLKVSDEEGEIFTNQIALSVLPVNDAPVISDYSPTETSVLMEGEVQEFSVEVSDIEEDELEIKWFLDEVEVGEGEDYSFSEDTGNYDLEVRVSDGELEGTYLWGVVVGDTTNFNCSEVGGYVFELNEICLGDLINVKDTQRCCSISGTLEFRDIDRCEEINENLKINIKKPSSKEDFKLGDGIEIKVEIENGFDEDLEFDIKGYLYNLDEQDVLEDDKMSEDIDKNRKRDVSLSLNVPEKLDYDDRDEYAVFVKVVGEDGQCNEGYVLIDVVREEHDVVVKNVVISPVSPKPGDDIEFEVRIENRGQDDEDVKIKIVNSDLGLDLESEVFEIENYDGDNSVVKSFLFKIPKNASNEKYPIKFSVISNDDTTIKLENLILKQEEKKVSVALGGGVLENTGDDESIEGGWIDSWMLGGVLFFVVILFALVIYFYLFYFGNGNGNHSKKKKVGKGKKSSKLRK